MGKVILGAIIGFVLFVTLAAGLGIVNTPLDGIFSQAEVNAPSDSATPGQRVYQSVERANNQASNLADAFDSMNMNPVGNTVSYTQSSNGASPRSNSESEAEVANPEDVAKTTCELTDEKILNSVSAFSDEGDASKDAAPSERVTEPALANINIARAYKLMESYAAMGTVCNDKYVKASKLLQQDWDAQYKIVRDEYNNFHDMVELAKSTAEEYFNIQSDLTSDIKSVELQQEQRQNDMNERELFEQWKGEADNTVLTAYRLMDDIEDMRIIIEKAALSAHFAALNKQAITLPDSLTALHSQLGLFHDRSIEIRQAFGGVQEDSQIN